MVKEIKTKYNIGDILFVSEYYYETSDIGRNHLFVVINDDNGVFPLEYFGFIVSSHIEKSNKVSDFKYNEPLLLNSINGLKTDSIVKCDQLYSFPKANIQFKIGNVDIEDYLRFINTFREYLNNLEKVN